MITIRNSAVVRVLVTVNLVLFVLGVAHVLRSPAAPARAALSQQPTGTGRTLKASPQPCVCTYHPEEGRMEQVPAAPAVAPVAPEPPPVVRNKIGQDKIEGQEFQVPNLVHYIWFNTEPKPLQFHHMLSVLSAHKFLQPDNILFHTDTPPTGPYWDKIRKLPGFKVLQRAPPRQLFGEDVLEPKFYTSHSNVDRVKLLMEHGGIYLDFDVLVTRSFDDLRRHVCTIGYESETKACGSVIVCSKESFFLYLWINAYLDDYRMDEWAYNTGKVPFKLSKRYPHLVHVEKTRLNRPNFNELDQIWGPNTWDWRKNYAVHTWYRLWMSMSPYYHGVEPDMENIKTWNSTFGEIARTILFGKPDKLDVY